MKLSIIIPVYNEKNTLEKLLQRLNAVKFPENIIKEIIIIDDASNDGSGEIIDLLRENYTVIHHEKNKGKGSSLVDGFRKSTGDIVVIQDADLEYDPEDINKLLAPILQGKADVVYGSRFVSGQPHRVLYFWHYIGNILLTTISNILTNLNLSDMETCYKMFTREVVDSMKDRLVSRRFGIEPEITAKVKRFRIYEVGISYSGRTYDEGKKVGWKDGFSAIWCIIRFNLFP